MNRSRRLRFWNRHLKSIEGHRYEAIESNQVNKLSRAVNAECLNGLPVIQFGKEAVTDKRGCNVISDSFVRGEVARTLPGNYRGDFFVGNAALLGEHNVSIDFIGCSELRTGDENSDFSNGFRQRRREGERFC